MGVADDLKARDEASVFEVRLFPFFLFSFLVPLLSWSTLPLTLVLGSCLAAYTLIFFSPRTHLFLSPIPLLVFCWCLAGVGYDLFTFQFSVTELFLSNDPLFQLKQQQFSFFVLLLVAVVLYAAWSEHDSVRQVSMKGLLFGGALAIALSLSHSFFGIDSEFVQQFFPRMNRVWAELGRPVGMFTDPNAYGLFSSLYFFLCLRNFAFLRTAIGRALIVVGLVLGALGIVLSGSRTSILFLSLTAVFTVGGLFIRSVRISKNALLLGVSSVVLISLFLYSLTFIGESLPTIGRLQRTFSGILSGNFELISDRFYFSTLSLYVFFDNLFIGVGPFRFSQVMTSYVDYFQLPLGLWVDNPNNAYLGFLAEYGALGLLVLVLVILGMKPRVQKEIEGWVEILQRSALWSILCILFFGPHYLFPEVMLFFTFIFALTFRLEQRNGNWKYAICVALLLLPLLFLFESSSERGLYQWEKSPNGEFFRWSGADFQAALVCEPAVGSAAHEATLMVRNGQPSSVTVMLTTLPAPVLLSPGELKEVTLPCPEYLSSRGMVARGAVAPVWIPGSGGDTRKLGVQIFHDSPSVVLAAKQPRKEGVYEFPVRIDFPARSQ